LIARCLLIPFGSSIWEVRKKCYSKSKIISTVARFIYNLYQYENCSSVALEAEFASEPFFPHGIKGIFVSGGASVGENSVIFQQVTIGSVTSPDAKKVGAPVIGDDVYIGAGAKIIGAVTVGNNVRIGANAVVYEDVPNNCVVVSCKQKNLHKEHRLDNKFYSFRNEWGYYTNGKFIPLKDEKILAVFYRCSD